MDTAAFETDRMLKLLTEALRRGPGSPEWHKAVSDLRDVATPEADEYRMLINARERLDGGKTYREVRAGPAFTRELFGQLNTTTAMPRRLPTGVIVKLLCLLTLVAAIGLLLQRIVQSQSADGAGHLSQRLFTTQLQAWDFSNGLPKDAWRLGNMPLEIRGSGLRAGPDKWERDHALLIAKQPLDVARGICLESRVTFRPGTLQLALVLVERPAGQEIPPALLALRCENGGVRVVSKDGAMPTRPLTAGPHLLRLKIADGMAVAEVDGQAVWTGRPPLPSAGWAAVSMNRTASGSSDSSIESLRVLAP